jgi:hypothetical protein
MTRKFKTPGVALFAMLALTAVSASTASAASYTSVYPAWITGSSALGNDVFTTEGGTVECAAHFSASLSESSSQLWVTPTYTGCKAFGFLSAEVTGCWYYFGALTTTWSDLNIVSPCTIKASTCHVTLVAQSFRSTVVTSNTGTDISVQANVSGLKYNVVTDGFLCPFNGTGAKTGATYKQGSAVTFDVTSPSWAILSIS